MKNPEDYVTEISKAMIEGRAAFMAGAGISLNRNSWLPDWEGLVYSLLKIIAGLNRDFEIEYIHKNYMQLLFNEVFLHLMSETLGSNQVVDAIRRSMDINEFNRVHKFLAWSMLRFHSTVITTNYDELIEKAGRLKIEPIKLHGTLNMPESMRFTVNHIFSPLNPEAARRAAEKIKGRTLLVLGYRGADEFDVMPFLFEQANIHKFIWITHGEPEKDLDPHTRKRLDERGDPYFRVNADDFLKAVYDQSKSYAKSDGELDRWDQWNLDHPIKTPDWWKQELEFWGRHIKKGSGSNMDFLWAKMLDYLRIYELDCCGIERRPAE
ncbi:NAD-dependent protein deacylase [uncultured archaeon]|nr:NAD-dependent protein deacylase [uncultured archaeon]